MRNTTSIIFARVVFWTIGIAFTLTFGAFRGSAQSNDLSYPTAITENQITGQIKARDIGDPRSTTYYFMFNGRQGDLFVNIVTKNLNGSVDIFAVDGMRPFANILVYADILQSETGRVLYLRKPEKLILRIQGRSPNDDPADFQIKFAGGFEAAVPTADEPPVPKVAELTENNSGIRVNSVGTIIAQKPKPKPTPKAAIAETAKIDERPEPTPAPEATQSKVETVEKPVVEDAVPVQEKVAEATELPETKEPAPIKSTANKRSPRNSNKPSNPPNENSTVSTKKPTETAVADDSEKNAETPTTNPVSKTGRKPPKVVVTDTTAKSSDTEPKPNPLANVNLVILFKDGTKVQRPMTEVLRFTADQTTLTVVSTNGRIAKFSILEVSSVTIQ
jgi:hypothetical protein